MGDAEGARRRPRGEHGLDDRDGRLFGPPLEGGDGTVGRRTCEKAGQLVGIRYSEPVGVSSPKVTGA